MLIRGGTVIDVDGERLADVRIGETVIAVGDLIPHDAEEIVEASGCLVHPRVSYSDVICCPDAPTSPEIASR